MGNKENLEHASRLAKLTARYLDAATDKKSVFESLTFKKIGSLINEAATMYLKNGHTDDYDDIVVMIESEFDILDNEEIIPFKQLEIVAKHSYISMWFIDITNKINRKMDVPDEMKNIHKHISNLSSTIDVFLEFNSEKNIERIDYEYYLEKLDKIYKKI